MKRILCLIISSLITVLSVASCTPREEPELGGQEIVDAENMFPTQSLAFGEGSAEYILLKSNYWFRSVPSGTLTKIESVDELEKFQKEHEVRSEGHRMLSIENFNGYAKKLDDKFFEEKILLAIHIQSGSGSERFYVSSLNVEGKCLEVGISNQLYPPDTAFTTDMASWHMAVEIERALLEGVTEFAAVNNTKHTRLKGNDNGAGALPVISLDENSMTYYLSYGKYLEINHRGSYAVSASELTLYVTEDRREMLIFDRAGGGFAYNAEASVYSEGHIIAPTFPHGTTFE